MAKINKNIDDIDDNELDYDNYEDDTLSDIEWVRTCIIPKERNDDRYDTLYGD
jgi:hypothetical protein